jgi:hypothetical protein
MSDLRSAHCPGPFVREGIRMRARLYHWMHLGLLLALVPTTLAAQEPAIRWMHIEKVPGGTACAARLPGDEVDTMLMLNKNGQLILVAGKADWRASGSQEIGLRIDGFELNHLSAEAFNNLVLLQVADETALKRLKVAKDIFWLLPSGVYHATVAGLGDALSWVQQCEQAKRRGSESPG